MLVDDDDGGARYMVGECFVHTPNDDADNRITSGALHSLLALCTYGAFHMHQGPGLL